MDKEDIKKQVLEEIDIFEPDGRRYGRAIDLAIEKTVKEIINYLDRCIKLSNSFEEIKTLEIVKKDIEKMGL